MLCLHDRACSCVQCWIDKLVMYLEGSRTKHHHTTLPSTAEVRAKSEALLMYRMAALSVCKLANATGPVNA